MKIYIDTYPKAYDILSPGQAYMIEELLNDSATEDALEWAKLFWDLGLCPEYNWVGHENKWFLATQTDAITMNEYIEND